VPLVVGDPRSPSVGLGGSSRLPVLRSSSSDPTWCQSATSLEGRVNLQPNRSLEDRASELQTDLQSDFEVLDNPVKDVFVDTADVLSLLIE